MANCVQCGRKLPGLSFGKKLCQWCVEYQAIQRGEVVESKQRVMPAPWVRPQMSVGLTQILFGINVAVFLGMALSGATVIPGWVIDAVSVAPRGAHPSYAHGYYERDNAFYVEWDEIAADRDRFLGWMDEHVGAA